MTNRQRKLEHYMLEKELEHLNAEIKNPVLVEDLLRDIVIESAFPNVRRLLIIYLLVSHAEAAVERGFSKMDRIMTKRRCSLDVNSLDLFMCISDNKKSNYEKQNPSHGYLVRTFRRKNLQWQVVNIKEKTLP